jgi:ribosomal protein L11 methyltransferase
MSIANPEYFSMTFDTEGFDNDIWMAMLGEWPFESFHEDGNTIIGYILKHDITQDLLEQVNENKGIRFNDYQMDVVPHQNWNAVWESSFNPVAVDDYCYIRAEFHPGEVSGFKHEVIIAPRMAFGTGHHATTFMMLQAMSKINFKGKRVFDFGCGTGILSVVAAMDGASDVVGVDIQPESKENSDEHALLNYVEHLCTFHEGGIDMAGEEKYDIILANINVTIIAKYFDQLKEMLNPGGYMLLSGIMTYDKKYMEDNISFPPLEVLEMNERNEWMQVTLIKD